MTFQNSLFDYRPETPPRFEFSPSQNVMFEALDKLEAAIVQIERASQTASEPDRAQLEAIREMLIRPLHELYDVYLIAPCEHEYFFNCTHGCN